MELDSESEISDVEDADYCLRGDGGYLSEIQSWYLNMLDSVFFSRCLTVICSHLCHFPLPLSNVIDFMVMSASKCFHISWQKGSQKSEVSQKKKGIGKIGICFECESLYYYSVHRNEKFYLVLTCSIRLWPNTGAAPVVLKQLMLKLMPSTLVCPHSWFLNLFFSLQGSFTWLCLPQPSFMAKPCLLQCCLDIY